MNATLFGNKVKRILIIEDDPDILDLLNIIFEDEGYEIFSFNRGTTVENIHLLSPDLILLDVRIVGFEKTGDQLCSELKSVAETQNMPIILLSAENNLSSIASKCGANNFLAKPFEIKVLLNAVKEFLA